jgi:hypothetical protein
MGVTVAVPLMSLLCQLALRKLAPHRTPGMMSAHKAT